MNIPKDPAILLSYINTQLRDYYPTLDELCKALNLNQKDIIQKLSVLDYNYEPSQNQFI